MFLSPLQKETPFHLFLFIYFTSWKLGSLVSTVRSRCQRLLWLKSISAAPDDGRHRGRGKERKKKMLNTFIFANAINLILRICGIKKEKRLHKTLVKWEGGEKKACACFVTSQYVQNQFPPPQTGCPQHARATAAERCKNTKHVSVCITCHLNHCRKVASRDSNVPLCLRFGFWAGKKGMNYVSQKHLNQKKTGKNIHIFDVN